MLQTTQPPAPRPSASLVQESEHADFELLSPNARKAREVLRPEPFGLSQRTPLSLSTGFLLGLYHLYLRSPLPNSLIHGQASGSQPLPQAHPRQVLPAVQNGAKSNAGM